MNWEDITIGVLVVVILYLLFRSKKEKMENTNNVKMNTKEYYQALCNKTTDIHNKAKEYLGNNCSEEKMDELKNFRNSINNRSWCRLKGEEEITSDINKDTWCALSGSEPQPLLSGYMPSSLEDLGEYIPPVREPVVLKGTVSQEKITPNI